jgi:hypothetical protein
MFQICISFVPSTEKQEKAGCPHPTSPSHFGGEQLGSKYSLLQTQVSLPTAYLPSQQDVRCPTLP